MPPPAPYFFAPPPAPAPVPAAPLAPAPVAAPPAARAKVAVLPLDDERLFRAERAELRVLLAGQLAMLATEYTILPLAEVDSKLRPVSATTGARCAFAGEPAERRAREQGWLPTDVVHVSGFNNKPEELWVEILKAGRSEPVTWTAPWNPRLELMDRYRASFAALVRNDSAAALGVLGGLGAWGADPAELREGPITVCETKFFGSCDASSAAWKDKSSELAACFAGEDDVTTEVLVQGDGASPRCEIEYLDALDGPQGQREACLCRAIGASSALRAKAGRRTVRVRFEATDLAGKPRPEIRVVETSNNLDSEADWHSIRTEREGKSQYRNVQRLVVDHLDALAAPLARCAVPPGSVVVADVDVREDGTVGGARLVTSLAKKTAAACVEKALGRGAFSCTDDGKSAKLTIAVTWPEPAK